MIRILYGERGSGKTERLIDMANNELKQAKGHVVFICKNNRHMLDVNHDIRYIDASEYGAIEPTRFIGFLYGLLAGNFDIEKIFLLSFPRLGGFSSASDMGELYAELENMAKKHNVEFIMSVRGDKGQTPEYMKSSIVG